MKKNFILGAGITGIMAKKLFDDAIVLESNSEGSNTYKMGANYLWEPVPLFQTKKVKVRTTVDGKKPNEASIMRYKNKIGKGLEDRGLWGEQFQPEMKGYVIEETPKIKVVYGVRIIKIDLKGKVLYLKINKYGTRPVKFDNIISSIPFPIMIEICELETKEMISKWFKYSPIFVQKRELDASKRCNHLVDVNYITSRGIKSYCSTKYYERKEEHIESLSDLIPYATTKIFLGKIWGSRMTKLLTDTLNNRGIYCFGRYASWNPDELIHNTYHKLKAFREDEGMRI